MVEIIDMGTVTSRGQISVPSKIRAEINLEKGDKVLFYLSNGTIIMKKVTTKSFEEITKPLIREAERLGLKQRKVNEVVHRYRKSKKK